MQRSIAVGVGLMEFPFDGADGFWRWVDLCEAGGIDSIWQTDRLVSRAPILESMTALAAIVGRTRRVKFGVNVVSVAMREPVLLAKQCATIDMLSGGRLLPGFGIGSPRGPEWTAMHLDPSTRGRKTDEALEIIRRGADRVVAEALCRHVAQTGDHGVAERTCRKGRVRLDERHIELGIGAAQGPRADRAAEAAADDNYTRSCLTP